MHFILPTKVDYQIWRDNSWRKVNTARFGRFQQEHQLSQTIARPQLQSIWGGRFWCEMHIGFRCNDVSTIVRTKSAATSVSSRIAEGRGHRGRRQAITAPSISSLLNRHGSVINKTRLNAVDNSLNFDAQTTFKAPSGVTPSEYLEWFGFVRMMLLQTVIEFRRCDS